MEPHILTASFKHQVSGFQVNSHVYLISVKYDDSKAQEYNNQYLAYVLNSYSSIL